MQSESTVDDIDNDSVFFSLSLKTSPLCLNASTLIENTKQLISDIESANQIPPFFPIIDIHRSTHLGNLTELAELSSKLRGQLKKAINNGMSNLTLEEHNQISVGEIHRLRFLFKMNEDILEQNETILTASCNSVGELEPSARYFKHELKNCLDYFSFEVSPAVVYMRGTTETVIFSDNNDFGPHDVVELKKIYAQTINEMTPDVTVPATNKLFKCVAKEIRLLKMAFDGKYDELEQLFLAEIEANQRRVDDNQLASSAKRQDWFVTFFIRLFLEFTSNKMQIKICINGNFFRCFFLSKSRFIIAWKLSHEKKLSAARVNLFLNVRR